MFYPLHPGSHDAEPLGGRRIGYRKKTKFEYSRLKWERGSLHLFVDMPDAPPLTLSDAYNGGEELLTLHSPGKPDGQVSHLPSASPISCF